MKLSTKGKYGLKAMFELARCSNEEPVSLKYIAKQQSVSDQYLEQIFSALKKAGLVKSVRGAQGGYLLSKEASQITVADILRVLEGDMAFTECLLDRDACENFNSCSTRYVWEQIKQAIENVTMSISLQDMVDDYNSNFSYRDDDISEMMSIKK
ncbi:RrF2 family transcriptional regulator [Peptostreptococcus canis]|uniref:Rrf2 family transcriptional regulator n=1 Tax=Peptostreptococcus canis TaxID=1159213 RepID=A0ABR6TMX6_9FIRM|nr:Rrf2 family transcriptional regulator [Peptostreptococcus canis]MBC2576786.1 Rrf2 family transcriptional regulator [Peptostreptococcus canis]MBP1998911.1 Rrf2 family protein [Peptostreptococcus canis]